MEALLRIERDGGYSDIVLTQTLARSTLSERDRAFVNELVRGVVRWKSFLEHLIASTFHGDPAVIPLEVNLLLKAAFYQIHFMRTPAFAAVNECIEALKARKMYAWTGVANGMLRGYLRRAQSIVLPDEKASPAAHLAVKHAHPEWMVARWLQRYGFSETARLCEANNQIPALSVRINRRRISIEAFHQRLLNCGASFQVGTLEGFVRIEDIPDTERRRLLQEGLMTIQDESAGWIGRLAAGAGSIIYDLCAAPGGKATQLAEENPAALIVAGDNKRHRARLIQEATQRLGLLNIRLLVADAMQPPLRPAPVVLLDAPCSGLGVIRKKPDIKWKRSPEDIPHLSELQKRLILRAADLTAVGGYLIYSTCTLEPEENEEIVDFLLQNRDFMLIPAANAGIPNEFVTPEGYFRTFPHLHAMDGAFAAKLIKRS